MLDRLSQVGGTNLSLKRLSETILCHYEMGLGVVRSSHYQGKAPVVRIIGRTVL
jgi:hypothetical protein